jgi:phenylacetate-CoA ligase
MTYRIRRRLIFAFLWAAKYLRRALLATPHAERFLRPGFAPLLARVGTWRLWLAFEQARKHVPAYRQLLLEYGNPQVALRGLTPDFSALPVTDKENYVRRWSIEERCRDGRMPSRGAVIDESSGSSGEPSNWVRGPEERADGRKLLHLGLRQAFGDEPLFLINAFALGPWATGMAVSMGAVDVAVLKSVGPDVGKIEKTLALFGPSYRYLIAGYPPFLKQLVESAEIDWSAYDCYAAVGGESMSEALRAYLGNAFTRVYSSFGASDLEINIATENDFTIALRQLIAGRPDLARALHLPEHSSLPMVFQYNPLDYYVETNEDGELVISICRVGTVSPKLRYNLRDLGCAVPFATVSRALLEAGIDAAGLVDRYLDLPLLFHWGRSDQTVAFYGANVTPADVQEVVFSLAELSGVVSSFAIVLGEDDEANKTLAFAFELNEGSESPPGAAALRDRVLERLAAVNQDYREASRFIPEGREPTLEFHAAGTGPFAGYDVRLKRSYIKR